MQGDKPHHDRATGTLVLPLTLALPLALALALAVALALALALAVALALALALALVLVLNVVLFSLDSQSLGASRATEAANGCGHCGPLWLWEEHSMETPEGRHE